MIPKDTLAQAVSPGLARRLAAIVYDGLLIIAVLFIAAAPLPALPEGIRETWWCTQLIRAYLLAVIFVFNGWFWVHGGQTLGMRAWRLRVVRDNGAGLRWIDALARFAAAVLSWLSLGAGYLWCLVDRQGLTWHDRLSRTRLVLMAKAAPRRPSDDPS